MKDMNINNVFYFLTKSFNDFFDYRKKVFTIKNGKKDSYHLKETMKWMLNAHKIGKDFGVSARYSLFRGWDSSYKETTGYIIPTFIEYSKISGDKKYLEAALKMTDWVCSVQLTNGGIEGIDIDRNKRALAFDTGQVLFGLIEAFRETKNKKYLNHAKLAGDFLVKSMKNQNTWIENEYAKIPHTYDSRVSWALLELWKETKEDKYKKIAKKQLKWTLKQQTDSGYFLNSNFKPNEKTNTHGLAYTVRGLLESGEILKDNKLRKAAELTASNLIFDMKSNGFLLGEWDEKLKMCGNYICLTGISQFSIIWFRLYQITGKKEFFKFGKIGVEIIKNLQETNSKNSNVRGGIPGSFPIYGKYAPMQFPNWSSKFFADSLMLKNKIMM